MNFVQIGAGAGDLDPSSNLRDGFTEFIKNKKNKKHNIFLVEANPKNIKKLKETWKDYKNTKIFNLAIVPNNFKKKIIKLFYSENDSPHFQLMSSDINHVKKYFPQTKIKSINTRVMKIDFFLKKYFKNKKIESFSLDIEGKDYDVLMDMDLNKYIINNISVEYLHLNKNQKIKLISKLIFNGYSYNGFGFDHNGIDWLFTKKKSQWNNFISRIFPFVHRIHYKRLNRILKKL